MYWRYHPDRGSAIASKSAETAVLQVESSLWTEGVREPDVEEE